MAHRIALMQIKMRQFELLNEMNRAKRKRIKEKLKVAEDNYGSVLKEVHYFEEQMVKLSKTVKGLPLDLHKVNYLGYLHDLLSN